MTYLPVLAAFLLSGPASDSVTLSRVFVKGEKDQYSITSHLQLQKRDLLIQTWIPEDMDLSYKFTMLVEALLPDGSAKVHYLRPTITEEHDETAESPQTTKTIKTKMDLSLTVSPANEILDLKDLAPAPDGIIREALRGVARQDGEEPSFVGDLIEMSVFFGPFDSSLDYSPKLPLGQVKLGDTWRRTMGFEPQKLKHGNKLAIQRVDYVYTYLGPMTANNRKIVRINAKLTLDSDLASYFNEDMDPDDQMISKLPMKLSASIDFDLDPTTLRTLEANATSSGEFQVTMVGMSDLLVGIKMNGETTMRLIGLSDAK